jgi:hypothetical protein
MRGEAPDVVDIRRCGDDDVAEPRDERRDERNAIVTLVRDQDAQRAVASQRVLPSLYKGRTPVSSAVVASTQAWRGLCARTS